MNSSSNCIIISGKSLVVKAIFLFSTLAFLVTSSLSAQSSSGFSGMTDVLDLIQTGRDISYHALSGTPADRIAVQAAIQDGGVSSDHLAVEIFQSLINSSSEGETTTLNTMSGLNGTIGTHLASAEQAYLIGDAQAVYQEGIQITSTAISIYNLALTLQGR